MKKLTKFLQDSNVQGVRPVRIAVVDDGIDSSFDMSDLEHASIKMGNSFWPSSPESANSYFVPSGNHGTQIAWLICQLCPRTDLYIARLEEQWTQSGHRVISATSAAQVSLSSSFLSRKYSCGGCRARAQHPAKANIRGRPLIGQRIAALTSSA
jgi:hypothetical protein